jgi:4-amino-4-deoxy-L-arabinose transferase-like glycosyltransferase
MVPMADSNKRAPTEVGIKPVNCSWRTASWLFLLALAVRIPFLFLADNNGTDAWARYLIARSWLENPRQLPSEVWLPFHFWLLGAALLMRNSELSARLLTVLFGAFTVFPYWGMLRRVFDPRVAFWSALLFALFGFHIGYSVTTSSEAPTIFFLVLGFYAWVRFFLGDGWVWLMLCGLGFIAASLCRFEVWLVIPLLALLSLDFSQGWASVWLNRRAWRQMVSFGLVASAGAVGWMLFSFWMWGDPLAAPKGSAWQSQHMLLHQSLLRRLIAVPGALVVTLSPLVAGLAVWGLVQTQVRTQPLKRALAVVALSMAGLQVLNSVTSNLTMARFTLMYSWLLIPYAFEGLCALSRHWVGAESRAVFGSVLLFFLLWQGGITVGAYYGPAGIAAELSSVAPTLPLDPELRSLTRWLQTQRTSGDVIVVDQYLYEAETIIRYSDIPSSQALAVPVSLDPSPVEKKVIEFLDRRHPRLLVYCPWGMLGRVWSLGDQEQAELPQLNVRLHRRWRGDRYRVYEVEFLPRGDSALSTTQNLMTGITHEPEPQAGK